MCTTRAFSRDSTTFFSSIVVSDSLHLFSPLCSKQPSGCVQQLLHQGLAPPRPPSSPIRNFSGHWTLLRNIPRTAGVPQQSQALPTPACPRTDHGNARRPPPAEARRTKIGSLRSLQRNFRRVSADQTRLNPARASRGSCITVRAAFGSADAYRLRCEYVHTAHSSAGAVSGWESAGLPIGDRARSARLIDMQAARRWAGGRTDWDGGRVRREEAAPPSGLPPG